MGQTAAPGPVLRYPEPTDKVADTHLFIAQLAQDVADKLPRGFIGEAAGSGAELALASTAGAVEVATTRVTVAARPTARRYRVYVKGTYRLNSNLVTALLVWVMRGAVDGNGNVTAVTPQQPAARAITPANVAGNPDSRVTVSIQTVPANTPVTFSVGVHRVGGGGTTDTAVAGECHVFVEDIGPA